MIISEICAKSICDNIKLNHNLCKKYSLSIPSRIGDVIFNYFLQNSYPQTIESLLFFTSGILTYEKLNFGQETYMCEKFFSRIIIGNLSFLDVSFCNLDEITCLHLGNCLEKTNRMEGIFFAGNRNINETGLSAICNGLKKSGENIKHLNFTECYLSETKGRTIADLLSHCTALESINISYNKALGEGVTHICRNLKYSASSLIKIDFSNCGVRDEHCSEIQNLLKCCLNLEYFKFCHNDKLKTNLSSIIKGVSYSNSLINLNFSNSEVTLESFVNIPEYLSKCTKLEIFEFSNNYSDNDYMKLVLEGLKYSAETLKKFDLTFCLREDLIEEFKGLLCKCSNLETFPSEILIFESRYSEMFKCLEKSAKTIKTIELNNFITSDNNSRYFGNYLSLCSNITEFNLGNPLDIEFSFLDVFIGLEHSCSTLKILRLSYCSLNSTLCKNLEQFLSNCQHLCEVDIGGNSSMEDGLQNICKGLLSSSDKLLKLSFDHCAIKSDYSEYLIDLLSNCPNLRNLNLQNNNFSHNCIKNIIECLKLKATKLTNLNLMNINCSNLDYANIFQYFNEMKSIKEITLQSNCCNEQIIYDNIFFNQNIVINYLAALDLSRCNLNPQTGKFIGKFLKNCQRMQSINLSDNCKIDDGLNDIFDSLIHSFSSLKIIEIRNCGIDEEKCKILGKTLKECTGINRFDFSENNAINNGIKDLCKGLKTSGKSLKFLKCDDCNLNETHSEIIENLLLNCTRIVYISFRNNEGLYKKAKNIRQSLINSINFRARMFC